MSNSDYQAGLGAGFARARSIQNEYELKIAEWRTHSDKLSQQISLLEKMPQSCRLLLKQTIMFFACL
ncbi:TPA: hypothetical protein SHT56_002286 [Pseudomonas aeruginosa]|nr:hypothetical protein [Pseudomonas aeruginosa]